MERLGERRSAVDGFGVVSDGFGDWDRFLSADTIGFRRRQCSRLGRFAVLWPACLGRDGLAREPVRRDVSSHYDDGLFLRVGAGEPDPFLRILESDLRRAAFESEADSDDRSGFPGPVRVFSVDPSGES